MSGVSRRALVPQLSDQTFGRHDATPRHHQPGQQRPLLVTAQSTVGAVRGGLHRSEDEYVQHHHVPLSLTHRTVAIATPLVGTIG